MAEDKSNIGNVREPFFFNQARVVSNVIASTVADFIIDGKTFEVGGKSKGQKQLQGFKVALL